MSNGIAVLAELLARAMEQHRTACVRSTADRMVATRAKFDTYAPWVEGACLSIAASLTFKGDSPVAKGTSEQIKERAAAIKTAFYIRMGFVVGCVFDTLRHSKEGRALLYKPY